MAQAFIHKQLDKLTSDIHRRTVHGVDEQSKRLVLHCDFSQDLSDAMADQSMCEFFYIISSSLFICVAHFFVMYVHKGCDSPSIAMFTADTIWNARSVKVFLLQHNTPVPPGQFNDTVVKVPKSNWLCSRRGCGCQKQYLQTLHKIFSIYWLKKKRKAGTLCLHQCSQRTKILYCTIHQNHK